MKEARYENLIEDFGGEGYNAAHPRSPSKAFAEALASGRPALINCTIDPDVGQRAVTSTISIRTAISRRSSQLRALP